MSIGKDSGWIPGAVVSARQTTPAGYFNRLLILSMTALLLLASFSTVAARQTEDLETTIQHLINYVRDSNVTFERNFSSHDSVEAARHIERKYEHFRDEIDSPEKFIELSATASLVTGKKYMVITPEGSKLPAGEWLNAELNRYRQQTEQQP